ncbi:major capsid protein P2 [Pyruvatibacter mobilis]|uniref:major capsid protein P2 n=1 Tax=Pyruvatibacter mobilis TaxID=1712261 RepID=UPI003BADB4AC
MSGNLISLPDPQGVAVGGTATADIPKTGAYRELLLGYESNGTPANLATMVADITQIRLRLNGVDQWVLSADDLIKLNSIYGETYQDGLLPLFFHEPHRREMLGEDAGIWGMGNVQSFQMEIKIASGATAPRLTLHALREPGSRPIGAIRKIKRYNLPVTNTGDNVYTPDRFGAYRAIHAKTANINGVHVKVDDRDKLHAPFSLINNKMRRHGLTPVTGWSSIIFDDDRRFGSMLEMQPRDLPRVQDFRVIYDMSAASGFDIITETFGSPDA